MCVPGDGYNKTTPHRAVFNVSWQLHCNTAHMRWSIVKSHKYEVSVLSAVEKMRYKSASVCDGRSENELDILFISRLRTPQKRQNHMRKRGMLRLKIRELRIAAGLTQEELAKKMRVDQSAVSRWESGEYKPQRKCHKKLAKVLQCTVEQLTEE